MAHPFTKYKNLGDKYGVVDGKLGKKTRNKVCLI